MKFIVSQALRDLASLVVIGAGKVSRAGPYRQRATLNAALPGHGRGDQGLTG
jgi:hypothetical protein